MSLNDLALFFGVPKVELAIAIIFTLSDKFGGTDPENLSSSTISILSFSIVMFLGLLEITLRLLVFIFIP